MMGFAQRWGTLDPLDPVSEGDTSSRLGRNLQWRLQQIVSVGFRHCLACIVVEVA